MDENSFKTALSGLGLSAVRWLQQTGSTNDDAAAWADAAAPDLALVAADEQTAGRGRMGRRWWTSPGSALAFSLVLRPEPTQPQQLNPARLSALGGLAVCLALEEGYGLAAQIKWPNDVLVGGKKLAGVLAESRWQGERLQAAVLGIGVNVSPESLPPQDALLFPATCVQDQAGRPVDRPQLLRRILQQILAWRGRLQGDDFLAAWQQRLAYRGEWVRISAAPDAQEGRLLGLNVDGSLRLALESGQEIQVYAGDLSLRPAGKPAG